MTPAAARRAVAAVARRLETLGLTRGSSGNVSVRTPRGFLITPTGMTPGALRPADIVQCDGTGTPAPRQRVPSSEWRIHRDLYAARADLGAVVHTHSPYATAIACLREPLPAVHYMIAAAGGADVRCAEYATFGSAELSAGVLRALDGRRACLLANHGAVAVGGDLESAVRLAVEVEHVAFVFWLARCAGSPSILDAQEMRRVLERFRSYGQPAPRSRRAAPRGSRAPA